MTSLAHRRHILTAALALACGAALAQPVAGFPSHPLRILVPFNAGGPVDFMARSLAQKLSGLLGQQVIVENKAGAATILGWDAVAKSPPDGHTLLLAGIGGRTTLPSVATLPFDPAKDLLPVSRVARAPNVFVVNAASGPKNMAAFIELAKGKAGRVNHGLAAPGTITQFVASQLERQAGLKLEEIPYRGGAPAVNALLSGEIDFLTADLGAVLGMLQSGKLRALAVADIERSPYLPEVPTTGEAGYGQAVAVNVYGLFVPAGTPGTIVARLAALVAQVQAQSEVREQYARLGLVPESSTPAAFESFLREQTQRWAPIAKASGVRVN